MNRAVVVGALLVGCSSSPPPSAPPASPPSARPSVAPGGHGRVETVHVASAALGVTKNVVVYLPAGYDTGARRYPVLYYLHGLGGEPTDWVTGGKLDEAADRLGLQAIVVMPDGDNSFYTDAVTPIDYDKCLAEGAGLFIPNQSRPDTCVRTPNYERWITGDLVAWTDATYRTIASKDGRAIAGLSMGGFGALQLALRHKDRYAAAASHSGVDALLYQGPFPYVPGKVELVTQIPAEVGDMFVKWLKLLFGSDIANWRAHDPAYLVGDLRPGELALYLDCGTDDVFRLDNGMRYLHDLLAAKHIDHAFYVGEGGKHDFSFWRPRLPESLAFLTAHVSAAR